jgi:ankyrin repeat protein
LHTAASEGLAEVVKYLLARDLLPDVQDNEGNRPLHLVAARKNTLKRDTAYIANILLDKGSNIHATNLHQQTALHCASFSGELATVALLCERGGSFQAKDVRGWFPVHIALGANALDIEEYLLSQGIGQDVPVTVEGQKAEAATTILLRATFFESREQYALLKEVLDTLYRSKEFQPIIEVAALHAMGTRRQHKALRLFLADGQDIASVSIKGGVSAYFPDSHVMAISTGHPFKKLVSVIAYYCPIHLPI